MRTGRCHRGKVPPAASALLISASLLGLTVGPYGSYCAPLRPRPWYRVPASLSPRSLKIRVGGRSHSAELAVCIPAASFAQTKLPRRRNPGARELSPSSSQTRLETDVEPASGRARGRARGTRTKTFYGNLPRSFRKHS